MCPCSEIAGAEMCARSSLEGLALPQTAGSRTGRLPRRLTIRGAIRRLTPTRVIALQLGGGT